ncbi:MAG TPA: inorganic phosphate transporter, partial [Thermoanaerobaculia bacterium]
KGIATLVGAGVSNYRNAVVWGSLWTTGGAVAAAFASQALVATFSGTGILVQPATSPSFLLSVALGAIGWLIIATRTGLPVSTTHSLAGALVGAAIAWLGAHGIIWSALASKVVLPLVASPVMALVLLILVQPLLRPVVWRFDRYCLCVEQTNAMVVTPEGAVFRDEMPAVVAGPAEACGAAVARISAIDSIHWVSSGATSFFRGMNDAPKILALGVAAALAIGLPLQSLYALVALAMGAGSVMAGFRVTRTLAEKVTPITPANGFAANVVTSALVGVASRFALPVSTTHVASGAIIGAGLSRGDVRWKTVGEMLLAWVVTLPASALLAAITFALLRH